MSKFLDALEGLRQERGETQEEFAHFIGIHQGQYTKIVRGCQGVGTRVGKRILNAFPQLAPLFLAEVMQQDVEQVADESRVRRNSSGIT